MAEKILKTEYSEEMQKSYLDYSMSVITARAVPDIRDGLKPVQRRLLYDMYDLGVRHDKKEMKSARISGDCMGRFHPHGDSSIYETMVVMAQPFKKSVPLVDGKGNFGSVEGDSAAAYRYTEAKLRKFTDEVFLRDLDKSVDFVPAYTNTENEPSVLPVRIPNFLLNGSEGIAVGMTTATPCHNLAELCDLCAAYIDRPEMRVSEMLEIMPGPDFPTGGIIANRSELQALYETGSGKLKLRGKLSYTPAAKRGEKDRLTVTEIPYTMIGSGIGKFMSDTAELVEAKKLPEITDIGNATAGDGVRIFLELKKDADVSRITNILYKKTKLEDTFGVNMLAICDGRPEVMTLPRILSEWLRFQHEIIDRKYRALLAKEEERGEIEEGLIAACNRIDLVIAVIRGAKSRKDAEKCLTEGDTAGIVFQEAHFQKEAALLHFTKRQTEAILELKLYRLIGLELLELEKAHRQTKKNIRNYEAIISGKEKRDELIKEDLRRIKEEYGTPRRTLIEDGAEAVYEENVVAEAPCVFVMDRLGYTKLLDQAVYEKNRETVDAENRFVIPCMNTGKLLLFTDQGNLHQLKCRDIPQKKLRDKGVPIENLSKYSASGEEIVFLASQSALESHNLLFVTKNGYIKQVPIEEFETNNRTVSATKLEEGDLLCALLPITEIGDNTVALWTDNGYFLRFALSEVPILKKSTKGVRGIRLSRNAAVAGAMLVSDDPVVRYKQREVHLHSLKIAQRGGTGTKQRV